MAQEVQPIPLTAEQVNKIPSLALAQGIRVITDGQLPFIRLAKESRMIFNFEQLGSRVTVTQKNAKLWDSALSDRLKLYLSVAESRGYAQIAGKYRVAFQQPDCGNTSTIMDSDQFIEITQSGSAISTKLPNGLQGIGTVVEENIIVNLGSTIGDVPYFIGFTKQDAIILEETVSKCRMTLTPV
jgi:hypothetical protein